MRSGGGAREGSGGVMKRATWLLGAAAVAVPIAVAGAVGIAGNAKRSASARREATRLRPETDRCRERLAQFHQAWQRYRTDHGGMEPPSVESLVPEYVHDPKAFTCPVAEKWMYQGNDVTRGNFIIGRRRYDETYSLEWLSASYPGRVKRLGDEAPVVICRTHREVLYQAAYDRRPPLGTFSPAARDQLVREVAGAEVLAVLRNGRITALEGDDG